MSDMTDSASRMAMISSLMSMGSVESEEVIGGDELEAESILRCAKGRAPLSDEYGRYWAGSLCTASGDR